MTTMCTHTLMLCLLIIASFIQLVHCTNINMVYSESQETSCSFQNTSTCLGQLSCAASCAAMDPEQRCTGFQFKEQEVLNNCNLCMSDRLTTTYLRLQSAPSFKLLTEMHYDYIIYLSMDSIQGGLVPVQGANPLLVGGPSTIPGVIHNAVHFYNLNTTLNNRYIVLGNFTDRCIDHPSLCTHGFTVAFWFKLDNKTTPNDCLVQAAHWAVRVKVRPEGLQPFFQGLPKQGDSSVTRKKSQVTYMADRSVWHHVAGVYDASEETFQVYVDGSPRDTSNTDIPPVLKGLHDISVGCCTNVRHCGNVSIDELKMWEVAKQDTEIMEIYNIR